MNGITDDARRTDGRATWPMRLLGVVAAAALVLFAPVAAAHAIPAELDIDPLMAAVPTAPSEGATNLTFTYRCSGFSMTQPSVPQNVTFRVQQAPTWLTARIEPERVALPSCTGVGTVGARAFLSAAEGGIAQPGEKLVLTAAWETDGMVVDVSDDIPVTAPYVPSIRVEAQLTELIERPQAAAVFPIHLTNLASGLTRVTFEVVDKKGGLQVPIPNPIVLQQKGGQKAGQDKATIPFTVMTPYENGFMDEPSEVTLRITPMSAADPTIKGEPQDLTFKVQTKGWYVPGAPIALVFLGIALVAMRLRR